MFCYVFFDMFFFLFVTCSCCYSFNLKFMNPFVLHQSLIFIFFFLLFLFFYRNCTNFQYNFAYVFFCYPMHELRLAKEYFELLKFNFSYSVFLFIYFILFKMLLVYFALNKIFHSHVHSHFFF